MNARIVVLLILAVILSAVVVAPAIAEPEEVTNGYYTFAWKVPLTSTEWNDLGQPTGNEANGAIWPQPYEAHKKTNSVKLNAVDGSLPECGVFQVDAYHADSKNDRDRIQSFIGGTLNWGDDHGGLLVGGEGVGWKMVDKGDCIPEDTTTTTVPETTTTTTPPPFCQAYTATIPQDGNGVSYAVVRFISFNPAVTEPADPNDLVPGVTYTVFSQVAEGFERDALPQGWVEVDGSVAYYNFTTEEELCDYEVPPISAQVITTTTTTEPEQETTTTTEPEQETTTTTEPEEETTTTVVEDTTTTVFTEEPVVSSTTLPRETASELPVTGQDQLIPFAIVGTLLALLGGATMYATRRN